MNRSLQHFHDMLKSYTVVMVPIMLFLTGVFFYFYFVIPDQESSVLFNFEVSSDVQMQAVEKRTDTIEELHERKQGRTDIHPNDVRDIFAR